MPPPPPPLPADAAKECCGVTVMGASARAREDMRDPAIAAPRGATLTCVPSRAAAAARCSEVLYEYKRKASHSVTTAAAARANIPASSLVASGVAGAGATQPRYYIFTNKPRVSASCALGTTCPNLDLVDGVWLHTMGEGLAGCQQLRV